MEFIKLDYRDYVVIRDLMEDVQASALEHEADALDEAERAVLGRVKKIIALMEYKRVLTTRPANHHTVPTTIGRGSPALMLQASSSGRCHVEYVGMKAPQKLHQPIIFVGAA